VDTQESALDRANLRHAVLLSIALLETAIRVSDINRKPEKKEI